MSFSYAQANWDPKVHHASLIFLGILTHYPQKEAFKTTNASDYTDKQKELRDDRRKPRAEPRDHLWLYGFENTAQMAQRRGCVNHWMCGMDN
jgi:hypothetical protein